MAALLCEQCGYVLEGLSESPAHEPRGMGAVGEPMALQEARCPECGTPIDRSRPERRDGSPWQKLQGRRFWTPGGPLRRVWAWLTTNSAMLLYPRATFDRLIVDERRWRSLVLLNTVIAAAILTSPLVAVRDDPLRREFWTAPFTALLRLSWKAALAVIVVTLALLVLTWIEARGVRFFGRARQWRVTRAVAWQVCAHASIGWIMTALLFHVTLQLWFVLSTYTPVITWLMGVTGLDGSMLALGAVGLALFGGMVWFETLVYVGVRRLKFANPPGAGLDAKAGGGAAG